MADDPKPAEKLAEKGAVPEEETPAWEGSLSDAPFMAAPDGHDVTKDALEEKPKR